MECDCSLTDIVLTTCEITTEPPDWCEPCEYVGCAECVPVDHVIVLPE